MLQERAIGALHDRDEAGEDLVDAGKPELAPGSVFERPTELLGERAYRFAAQVLVAAEHGTHAPGEAAHPVANRHLVGRPVELLFIAERHDF
jgi:hypothetical protein